VRIHAMGLLALLVVACGSPAKPAEDATEMPKEEAAPKWDSETTASAASTSGAASAPKPPPGQRHDQYDKEATEVTLKRATRQVRDNCGHAKDDDGKATGPWGKMTITLVLGPNGHMKSVTVPPPYEGKPVGNCIAKAFDNLSFPPWAGQETTLEWEVEVVKPEGAAAPPKKK
jgi:hypothetical protein